MPILEVEIVTLPGEEIRPELARALADRVGAMFGSAPGNVWVRLRLLPPEQYAENQSTNPPYPVFVTILKALWPANLAQEVAQLTKVIAEVCGRDPTHVHVIYLPEALGRVAFGGKLATSHSTSPPKQSQE